MTSKRRWKAVLLCVGVPPVLVIALWVAIHRVSWLGPALADGARAIVGPSAVATAQDVAYGIEDRWNRFWRSDQAPQPYWDVPPVVSLPAPPASSAPNLPPRFLPANVGPMNATTAAPGDGTWVPIDPPSCIAGPCLFKTLLHPDPIRAWTTVAIVAVDVASTRLHLVAGVQEPKATTKEAKDVQRPGLVPERDRSTLIAAFNGGFKTEHGALGMQIDGLTFLPSQRWGCTIARGADDKLFIVPHDRVGERLLGARWWRQAPPCLVDEGAFAPGVLAEGNINWGKAVSGDTIIRRSAIGLDKHAATLFVGIGDATSAGSIARAMHHAGAHSVAQLDVNWSYPKFLIYDPPDEKGRRVARAMCPGFEFSEQDYFEKAASRDFFYLTRRE